MIPSPDRPAAATEAAGLGSTLIRLEGRDALALLDRISTQSLAALAPGQARATLFCDFRGRLLHRALVGRTSDGAVWLLRDDAPGCELAAFVDRLVFREDVRIADRSAGSTVRCVPGVRAPAGTLEERAGVPVALWLDEACGFEIGPGPERALDPESERARIHAGRPRHGHEVHSAFNPFEVGLAHEIHLDKGCFTGQETLMRLVTYRSVRRRLARVGGRGAPTEVPRAVRAGGEVVGRVTSAVADGGDWIGLAVLGNDVIDAPARLEIEGGGEIETPVAFPATRPLGLP